jgi:hypothetical protein
MANDIFRAAKRSKEYLSCAATQVIYIENVERVELRSTHRK